MFYVAKLIEALGVAEVTYGLVIGLTDNDSLRQETKLLFVGVAIFYFGRLVERWASA